MRDPLVIYQVLEKNQFNTGSVHQMFQAAAGLAALGHRVTVVSRDDETLRRKCDEHGVRFEPLAMRNSFDVLSIRKLARLLDRDRPDVIHVHKGIAHSIALAASWRTPPGAFVVNRGVSFALTRWNRLKYATRRVDRVVTVCEQIKQVIVASGNLPSEKVEVVYAGVDTSLFDPARWDRNDFRSEKGIAREAFLFAQVGVRDWKGWRELVEAFGRIAPRFPEARLMLIAYKNAEQKREIESYAAQFGIADRVIAVEYRSDMARVLASADCVVDASWGGTGITGTIREAMALRKPVIATDCGGNRELVSSPDVGWLIPPRDEEALVRAMTVVVSDRERSVRVAENAMQHVRSGFTKELRVAKLEALYRRVIAARVEN